MKTFRIAAIALAVSGVFASGAKAASTTNDWWDVTFDDKLEAYMPDDSATAMIVLTQRLNLAASPQTFQTWDSGIWYTEDGDETTVTNQFNPTNLNNKAYGDTTCLKLDTQGNDLTWRVDPTNTMADSRTALVDADLYLVGSDSPPDAADFDGAGDVQAAVYLKNETNEDTGETTNSVLCVYVWDSDANGGNGGNVWQELKGEGVKLDDNSWASVKVVVDHAKIVDPQNNYPVVQVFVNGVLMTARDGNADHWTAANADTAQTAGRVSSVAFRGTGAVDNFVGKNVETTYDKFDFTAEVYMRGSLVEVGDEGNVTRVRQKVEAGAGKVAKFEGFLLSDYDYEYEAHEATWALSKVVVIDQGTGAETTYNYEWDGYSANCLEGDNPALDIKTGTGAYGDYQTGFFDAIPTTAGATKNGTIIKIYFDDLPEEGTFNAKATTTIAGTTTTDAKPVKPSDFEGGATKTITWEFPATKNGNVLYTIQVFNGADLVDYADKTATVSVTLDEALLDHTVFAAATYVAGTLADGQDLERTKNGDTYTFAPYTPPVAIIVAGNVTNKYDSLRGAVTNATAGDTIYLVADDRVTFSADDPILDIDFEVTIDGGSNTLYGMTAYAGLHEIRISGTDNVTIKNLKFSEFGDTAPVSQYVMPICTRSTYTGKLTLDGVSIDKFNRQAVLLCGGLFEITNSAITGCAGSGKTSYFQSGIENYFATGIVAATTVSGIGALDAGTNDEGDPWVAAVFTVNQSGNGSFTVLSGDYEGQFIVAANLGSAGSVILSNGTFVATAPKTNEVEGVQTPVSAFILEGNVAVTVAGGWYDREPEAAFVADGLSAVDYGAGAPDARATWTVEGEMVTVTWVITEASSNMVRVAKGSDVAAYAGNDLVNEGKTFVKWTLNGEDVVFPVEATANLTFVAVWEANVEPKAVTIGGDADNPLPAGTEPITVDATDGFTLRFAAKQTGVTYILQSAATVDGAFADVTVNGTPVSVTPQAVDDVVELTDPDVQSTVKFFRVRVVVAE